MRLRYRWRVEKLVVCGGCVESRDGRVACWLRILFLFRCCGESGWLREVRPKQANSGLRLWLVKGRVRVAHKGVAGERTVKEGPLMRLTSKIEAP